MIQYLHSTGYRLETAGRTPCWARESVGVGLAAWARGLLGPSRIQASERTTKGLSGEQTGLNSTRARGTSEATSPPCPCTPSRLSLRARAGTLLWVGTCPSGPLQPRSGCRSCEPLRRPEERPAAHGPGGCPPGGLGVKARAQRESGDLSLNPGKTLAPWQPGPPPSLHLALTRDSKN